MLTGAIRHRPGTTLPGDLTGRHGQSRHRMAPAPAAQAGTSWLIILAAITAIALSLAAVGVTLRNRQPAGS
jgi:hypothetical protein